MLAVLLVATVVFWWVAGKDQPFIPTGGAAVFDRLLLVLIGLPLTAFALTAFVALVWFATGSPPETSVPVFAVIALALICGLVIARSLYSKPRAANQKSKGTLSVSKYDLLAAICVTCVFLFPMMYASIWMGAGDYPSVFFNVDAAYYLTQVQALRLSDVYPPPSLNSHGFVLMYHYGVQLLSALLPRFHVAAAHTGLFWLSVPLFLLGITAVSWRLALRAKLAGVPLSISILIAFFFVTYPLDIFSKIIFGLFSNPARSLSSFVKTFLQGDGFGGGYQIPSSIAGSFAVSLIALAITDRTLPFRLTAIAIACGTLPLFKSVYILPVGICVGIWAIIISVRDRSFGPLIAAGAALLIAISLSAMSVRSGFEFQLSINPFSHGADWTKDVLQKGFVSYAALWTTAALLCAMLYWHTHHVVSPYQNSGVVLLLSSLVILFLPVFLVVTYIDENGVLIEQNNAAQWFTPLRQLCVISLIAALTTQWRGLDIRRKRVAAFVVVTVSFLPMATMVKSAVMVAFSPSRWHEYVENSQIAPALSTIPQEASIVATNDLYYPANHYSRDRRQFQIAALFGHQAYGSAVRYDQISDAKERVRAQELLTGGTWGPEHLDAARKGTWTHILLSRRIGIVQGVPGKLIYESPAYLVYDLRGLSDQS